MTVPHLAAVMMMLLPAAASRNFVWPLQRDRVADMSECRQDRESVREREKGRVGSLHRDSFCLPN